jgi:hypothetical protein
VEESAIVGATELTQADFLEVWSHVPAFRRTRTYTLFLPVFWLVLAIVTLSGAASVTEPSVLLPLLGTSAFVAALVFALLRMAPRSWAKQAFADNGSATQHYRFDEQGLSVDSDLRKVQLAWPALPNHLETPKSFVVYTSSQTIFVIPKRAFDNASLPRLRQLLQARLPLRRERNRALIRLMIWVVALALFLSIWHVLGASQPR